MAATDFNFGYNATKKKAKSMKEVVAKTADPAKKSSGGKGRKRRGSSGKGAGS